MLTHLFYVCLSIIAGVLPLYSQPDEDVCPDLAARLSVDEWARVRYDYNLNFRPEPTVNIARVDVLLSGMTFLVNDGPVCADGYIWWGLTHPESDVSGWVAEGDPDSFIYWLEPRGIIETRADENGIERRYVVDKSGAIIERAGCMQPPEDYTQVTWGNVTFNQRTVAMLQQAERIYNQYGGRTLRFEDHVVQGSYNPGGVAASFGTHDGGGAVDLSVRDRSDFSVMTDEIPHMIDALRTAGFAAWVRRDDELYPGSVIHIHAIAIGDEDRSDIARAQVEGPFGYLRGFNGLPPEDGADPIPDADGAPIICEWMRDPAQVQD